MLANVSHVDQRAWMLIGIVTCFTESLVPYGLMKSKMFGNIPSDTYNYNDYK